MDRKKAVLVGRDAAPSGCYKRLKSVLNERGFKVNCYIGEGRPLTASTEEITRAARGANVVVLGMSSSPELAEPEMAAGEAAKSAGVPYGFYGDVPHCWARARNGAWFNNLASDAAFYFGVTQSDANAARAVFPNARLVGTGNPLREEMAFPRFSRNEVRKTLNIAPEEILVLAPGGKFAAGNMASWVIIMDALAFLTAQSLRFRLIIAAHPGDRTPYVLDPVTQKEMGLYEELLKFSPVPARIVTKDVLSTSDIVPGADIIVEFESSIGIEGAYQDIPVVSLAFHPLFLMMEQAHGTRELEAVSDGLSELVVSDASRLADTINRLLTPEGFAQMRKRQLELCPKPPERGAALRKIAEEIARIA